VRNCRGKAGGQGLRGTSEAKGGEKRIKRIGEASKRKTRRSPD